MIRIDPMGSKPIYEQIIDAVKEDVLKGYLLPGDAIPSVRKLAMDLKVTPNTVAKAYQELERQKIIVTMRGKGAFIAATKPVRVDADKELLVKDTFRTQIMELIYLGYSKEDIVKLAESLFEELKEEEL